MKKYFILPILTIVVMSCGHKTIEPSILKASEWVNNPIEPEGIANADTSLVPKIHFYETEFDFGDKIMEGEVIAHTFKYKNTGKSPLVINKVETSCGCTVSSFSKEPLAAGMEGEIKITYDSNGRPGSFQKSAVVITNTIPNEIKLIIIGDVTPIK